MRQISEKSLQMIADREMGMTLPAIAKKYGVSRQRVQQVCAKYVPNMFIPITPEKCVYPILRKWMNENRVSKYELIRRMGNFSHPSLSIQMSRWMRGEGYPLKQTIDKILAATGLTYEQLFYRED